MGSSPSASTALPESLALIAEVERTGWLPPLRPGSFFGYTHRPMQLRSEARAAGLSVVSLVSVEGAASMLADLDERATSSEDWRVVLDTARASESVPELIGIGPSWSSAGRHTRRGLDRLRPSAATANHAPPPRTGVRATGADAGAPIER